MMTHIRHVAGHRKRFTPIDADGKSADNIVQGSLVMHGEEYTLASCDTFATSKPIRDNVKEAIVNSINELRPNQRHIMRMIYKGEMTNVAVSEELGISRQAAFKSTTNACRKLRKKLKERGVHKTLDAFMPTEIDVGTFI